MTTKIIPSSPKSIKICSVEDCDTKRYCKGYCQKHYCRVKRYGNPSETHQFDKRTAEENASLFWSLVQKSTNPNGCWEWTALLRAGYGRFWAEDKLHSAHIYAWKLTYGKFPDKNLLHSCDNKRCVRVEHLREGTQKENIQEALERGFFPTGERCGASKLTVADVLEIRRRSRQGELLKSIAKDYLVHEAHISRVARGLLWKEV